MSLLGDCVAVAIGSGVGSVVFPAFRHVERSGMGTTSETNRDSDVLCAFKL